MLSEEIKIYARECWDKQKQGLSEIRDSLEQELEKVEGDERILLELLYGTLPVSDVAGVPVKVLMGYIRHALYLRRSSPFCKDLPEDSFLHYVFYPRINSEDLCDCREFFAAMIMPRLEGLGEEEAVLEVNKWCAENMTYESSDTRTENPITAYYSGLGRCGEESTFAVTAFRSVGIPARQIYVPYWVHCDDNHAWVEVFAGGKWNFLGACEPEPRLNLGWFNDASSRAPLACCRTFMDYIGEGLCKEQLLERNGCSVFFNVTPLYTAVSNLWIHVSDENGSRISGASVRLEVVNMAAYRPIYRGRTDERGTVTLQIGRSDYHLEVRYGDALAMKEIHVGDTELSVDITIDSACLTDAVVYDLDYVPSPVIPVNPTALTEEQKKEKADTLSACANKRLERIQSYFLPEYENLDSEWKEILHMAGGNAATLYHLYEKASEEKRSLYKNMLHAMTTKDYRDVTEELLISHLQDAVQPASKGKTSDPHWIPEVVNPRLRYEALENWRPTITAAFSEEEKEAFVKDPASFMEYLEEHYTDGGLRYYPVLSLLPTSALKLGHADRKGRNLLFTAGMRTFGVPARINPIDECPQYFRDGTFHDVQIRKAAEPDCMLHLIPEEGIRFQYGVNFSISKKQQDSYQPLDYPEETVSFPLFSGAYRLVVSNRLPNGSQLCRITYFTLQCGEEKEMRLTMREASPEEMVSRYQLEPFSYYDSNEAVTSDRVLTKSSIVIYPEPGREPTEHLFNELIQANVQIRKQMETDLDLIMVFTDEAHRIEGMQNATLQKFLRCLPDVKIYTDHDAVSVMLARKMFLEPGVWPLMVLTDEKRIGMYGTCGYQVGNVELVLKILESLKK